MQGGNGVVGVGSYWVWGECVHSGGRDWEQNWWYSQVMTADPSIFLFWNCSHVMSPLMKYTDRDVTIDNILLHQLHTITTPYLSFSCFHEYQIQSCFLKQYFRQLSPFSILSIVISFNCVVPFFFPSKYYIPMFYILVFMFRRLHLYTV